MHIKRIHEMLECLTEVSKNQLDKGASSVNTDEMGKVVDMIKDLSEAEYYSRIAKSMEEYEEDEKEAEKFRLHLFEEKYGESDGRRFYDHYRYANGRFAPKGSGTYRRNYSPYLKTSDSFMPEWDGYEPMERERMRDMDRSGGRMYYTDSSYPIHDRSESRYDKARRMYTESKEVHKANTQTDKEQKMKDLENYFKEISEDLTEAISDATAEEKAMVRTKLTGLAGRI
jgi:hypothetical protein